MPRVENALLPNLRVLVPFVRDRPADRHLAEDVVQESLILDTI